MVAVFTVVWVTIIVDKKLHKTVHFVAIKNPCYILDLYPHKAPIQVKKSFIWNFSDWRTQSVIARSGTQWCRCETLVGATIESVKISLWPLIKSYLL